MSVGADECGIFVGFVWVMRVNGTFFERVWVNVFFFFFYSLFKVDIQYYVIVISLVTVY